MSTINSPLSPVHKPAEKKSFFEKLSAHSSCLNKLKMWHVTTINIFVLFIIWLIYSNKSYLKIDIALYAISVFAILAPLSLLIAKTIILNRITPENIKKISSLLTRKPSGEEDSTDKKSYIPGAKHLLKLSSIAISLSFILVLFYYKYILNNTGTALQITSSQFIQSKQLWMIIPLLILAALYFITLPAFLLSPDSKIGAQIFFSDKKVHQHEDWNLSYKLACIFSLPYFFISTFPLSLIFDFLDSESINIYLIASISLSFLIGQGSIVYNMWEIARLNGILSYKLSRQSTIFTITAIITILISLLTIIQGILPTMGNAIVNPGSSITKPESLYSCVFTGNTQKPEPKSFGIIISSNTSSIHMLTPSFNEKDQVYAKFEKDHPLPAEKLTETHLTIKKDYYIEKYDPTKHWYNERTGMCEYYKH